MATSKTSIVLKGDPGGAPASALPDEIALCPACGTATVHRHLYFKNRCDIRECCGCGLARSDTASFDPAAYYTGDYFSGGHADGYADYLGAESVLRREFARMVQYIRRYRPSGRLLEIGCAYGFFLLEARRHFDVAGIELARDAAERCRRNGLQVLPGVADEASLRALGRFDVIVLLDVVEHLPHPDETLALCARHLEPDGIIVLTTGDFGSRMARALKSAWRLMTPPQHLWFFTAASIENLSRRSGLSIERIDHPGKLVPLSLIMFQLGRMLGLKTGMPRASRVGIPVNLFDAMRVVLRRQVSS